jgi:hypothetical protein
VLAVIWIVLLFPETAKLKPEEKPMLPDPDPPTMEVVAITLPLVEKSAPELIA